MQCNTSPPCKQSQAMYWGAFIKTQCSSHISIFIPLSLLLILSHSPKKKMNSITFESESYTYNIWVGLKWCKKCLAHPYSSSLSPEESPSFSWPSCVVSPKETAFCTLACDKFLWKLLIWGKSLSIHVKYKHSKDLTLFSSMHGHFTPSTVPAQPHSGTEETMWIL